MLNFVHFEKIDSTNSEGLRRLSECASSKDVAALNKTVFVAKEQTAGRGRMGRDFYSPKETGIYFSAVYAPKKNIEEPAVLTAAAAVSVCRALEKFFSVEAKIKWVNDVYVGQKKVCGILTEGHLNKAGKIDAAVVGIGINITTKDFPDEIAFRAGSVVKEGGLKNDCGNGQAQALVECVCQNLFTLYEDPAEYKNAIQEYKARSFLAGREVKVVPVIGQSQGVYMATVVGIDDSARLIVRTQSGEIKELNSGEISISL